MKSRITEQFRRAFANLPEQVQQKTREAYRQFKQDPSHPSLRFKKLLIHNGQRWNVHSDYPFLS